MLTSYAGYEWSLQDNNELRFKRFKGQLGKDVRVHRGHILVIGQDQRELEKMMLGTIFAMHTSPWRGEIDFWKSFIDVDLEFLESLDKTWVE